MPNNLKLAGAGLGLLAIAWLGLSAGGIDSVLLGLFMPLRIGGFGVIMLALLSALIARTGISRGSAMLSACGLMIAQGLVISQFDVSGTLEVLSNFTAGAGWFFLVLGAGLFTISNAAAARSIAAKPNVAESTH